MTSRTILLLLFYCLGSLHAQIGLLDVSFSGDGKLLTPIGGGTDRAFGVAVQSDNKIVAVGVTRQSGNNNFAIVRYLVDGALDVSFSGDGIVDIDFEGGDDEARDVVILPDGNILVAGTANSGLNLDFALALLDHDGKLLSSFDGDGLATYDFINTDDVLSRIAVYEDRIYAVGYAIQNNVETYAIAAIHLNGTIVSGFSQDGKMTLDIGPGGDVATSVAVQADEKILVAGHTGFSFEKAFCVVRVNPDGGLDNSFASDGVLIPDVGPTDDRAIGVALQADQKIILGGTSYVQTGDDFALIRLLPDGTLDTDFGDEGTTIVGIGPFFDDARDMLLQPDDKILITGYAAQASTDADFGLARFTADGILDNTFSQDGKVITIIGNGESEDEAHAIALQPDGKIVLVGEAENSSGNLDFALARYLSGLNTSLSEPTFVVQTLTIFPNPAKTSLNIVFDLNEDQVLEFSITDINGSHIKVVTEERHFIAGNHSLPLELPSSLSAGSYILKVKTGDRKFGFYKFLVM